MVLSMAVLYVTRMVRPFQCRLADFAFGTKTIQQLVLHFGQDIGEFHLMVGHQNKMVTLPIPVIMAMARCCGW
jgi:hypothetical protein